MKKSAKRSIIVSAVLAIIMCVSLVAGATFALFTSDSKVNITVSSGKVNVVATVDNLITYSGKDLTGNAEDDKNKIYQTDNTEVFPGGVNGTFYNGGSAEFSAENENTLLIQNMTPGDKVTFDIKVQNNSNVAIQYRTIIMCEEDNGLFSGLTITLTDGDTTAADGAVTEEAEAKVYDGRTAISKWASLDAEAKFNPDTVHVAIDLPSDRGNEYQEKSCKLSYKVEAVQGNAETVDNALEIYNVVDLMYFQKNSSAIKGTVKLMADIDLDGAEWTPVDWYDNQNTFDGNGHTVSNFIVNVDADKVTRYEEGAAGFFAHIRFVKNLTVANAEITGAVRVGGIVGNGEVSEIDNCHVIDSLITAKTWWNPTENNGKGGKDGANHVGGIVGYLSSSDANAWVKDCSVIGCTIKGYRDIGGLIGTRTKYNGDVIVTGNTVKNVALISDRSENYKEYTEESQYNIGAIIGRSLDGDGTGTLTTEGNDSSEVTINIVSGDTITQTQENANIVIAKSAEINSSTTIQKARPSPAKALRIRPFP